MRNFLLVLACLALSSPLLRAQAHWEGGLFLGVANYQGDFVEETYPFLREANLAAGAQIKYNLNTSWSLGLGLLYGQLSGDDANYPNRANRGMYFTNTFYELSMVATWEPWGANRFVPAVGFRPIISPYFFIGGGAAFLDAQTFFPPGKEESLQEKIEQDQRATNAGPNFVMPFGLGVKFDLSENFYISVEGGFRMAFTDYLDGLSQAGNPNRNDWYQTMGLSLIYRLPGS